MTTETESLRQKFERHIVATGRSEGELIFEAGHYLYPDVQEIWELYQAGHAAALASTAHAAAPKTAPAVQHGGATRAAARALSDRVAEMCNVDKEDHWMHHSDDVLSDAELVISTYLAAQAQAMPAAVAPQNPPMPETWHVDVHVHGEKILSIGYDWLSGKGDLTESEAQAVVGMAQHLLSFVGYGLPQSGFDPDADEQAPAAQGDALPREEFAWVVVQEACETDPADEDDPECIRILRRDLKSAVLAAFLREDAARMDKEGDQHG